MNDRSTPERKAGKRNTVRTTVILCVAAALFFVLTGSGNDHEFVVADTDDPEASAHDATVKCVYTDEDFYALIVSATDPEHGLAAADGFELVDHEGRPYEALPEGKYTVQVVMSSADGEELASSSEEVEIGRTDGTIIHEITTFTAIEKGGMDLLNAWAADENLTILVDLLPGFFGPEYQMSILPMSVSCETAEYLPGRIKTEKGMRSRGQSVNSRSICNSRKP